MSEDTAPLVVTLKAGTEFSAPWIVVRGDNPDDVAAKLRGLDAVIEATHEAAGLFAAGRLAAPQQQAAPDAVPPTEQPKQQPWGQQQSQPAQQNQPRQTNKYGGQLHPEGKTCEACPNVLEKKQTSSGKSVWRCDQWRWNSGSPNGHTNIFID